MGVLTPVAIKVGSIRWLPRYLPAIVRCDNAIRAATREHYGLLDIAGLPNTTLVVAGRTSGIRHRTRLLAVPDNEGYLIAGSFFGGPKTPQWVHNLRAADAAAILDKGIERSVTVRELVDADRDAAWQRMRGVWPNFDIYEQRTDRTIPVFELKIVRNH